MGRRPAGRGLDQDGQDGRFVAKVLPFAFPNRCEAGIRGVKGANMWVKHALDCGAAISPCAGRMHSGDGPGATVVS